MIPSELLRKGSLLVKTLEAVTGKAEVNTEDQCLRPPSGKRWLPLLIHVKMVTDANTGNRYASYAVIPSITPLGTQLRWLWRSYGLSTSASSTYHGYWGLMGTQFGLGQTYMGMPFFLLGRELRLAFFVSGGKAGDTIEADMLVLEFDEGELE